MKIITAILAIAYRDLMRYVNDKTRVAFSFVFPMIFIVLQGSALQSNLGENVGFNFLIFTFTGVVGQNLFQSTASGIISLIEDRENNYSQELFVAPVPRWGILFGKILGESLVSLTLLISIVIIGIVMRLPIDWVGFSRMLLVALPVCLFGGAFGLLVMGNLGNQRSANQVFPFIMFPQFFLSGAFFPVVNLPLPLLILSRIAPMTYAVDLMRSTYYLGSTTYDKVVLFSPWVSGGVILFMGLLFLAFGTWSYSRNEKNK